MSKLDGGPAFSASRLVVDTMTNRSYIETEEGMSLRDWYAGMAMQGLLVHWQSTEAADLSFKMADAMIAERDPKP